MEQRLSCKDLRLLFSGLFSLSLPSLRRMGGVANRLYSRQNLQKGPTVERETGMAIPTLNQTEGVWTNRTKNQGYHYVQEVFPGDTPREHFHRANCRLLITRGHLAPENHDGLQSSQRVWDLTQRYSQVHT